MFKKDKFAAYFIIAVASFQCWYASVLPVRADEAYLFLKSSNLSWFNQAHPGVSGLITYYMSKIGDNIFILRLPSILMMSFAGAFVYKSAYSLGGKISGWAALIIYMLTPSVNLAYVSVTPAACFVLFASIGFFFWLQAFETDKPNYYVGAGAASSILVMCHWSGLFLFAFALIYILLCRRELLFTKNFLFASIFFIFCPLALIVAYFMGIPIIPGSVPFIFTESKSVLLALGFLSIFPIIYVIAGMIGDRFKTEEFRFLNISILLGIILFVCLNFLTDLDLRYLSGFFIPIFVLSGAYFVRKDNKIFLGGVMALVALLSAYTKVAQKDGFYIPSGIKASAVYQAINTPLAKVLENSGAVFATNIPDASLYAFHTFLKPGGYEEEPTNLFLLALKQQKKEEPLKHPEACTIDECSQNNGAFIAENKENTPVGMFGKSDYYGIFRLTTPKEGTRVFHIYTVQK